jgi:ADP-ribose pyrophosphatase YjhB (NUDIX family)
MVRSAFVARCWRVLPRRMQRLVLWLSNTHFLVGTAALIWDDGGRVLVARHTYRRGPPWGLLGGWVRRGEDPAATVVREVREETALDVVVDGPLAVRRESPIHLTIIYAAHLRGGTFQPSDEVSEIRFLRRGERLDGLREDHRALIAEFGEPGRHPS